MSEILDSASTARINSQARGAALLIEMDFGSGTQRFTSSPMSLTVGGNFYLGLSNVSSVSTINESETNSAEKLTLSFSVVNQAMLAMTLSGVENYRGKQVRVYLQLMTPQFQPDGAPIRRWSGYMDRVAVTRTRSNADAGGNSEGKIEMSCARAGMYRARNYQGRRLTNTQQQQLYPGDRGLEFLQSLIETPALWLSKAFQKV